MALYHYENLSNLLYHYPARVVDSGVSAGGTIYGNGQWIVTARQAGELQFRIVGSYDNPRGYTVERNGTTLDVISPGAGETVTVAWPTSATASLILEIVPAHPTSTVTEVIRYVYDFAATIPSGATDYLDAPWSVKWEFADGRILDGVTLDDAEVPDPALDPDSGSSIRAVNLVSAWVEDGQGNRHPFTVSVPLYEEFCGQGCTDMAGGLLFPQINMQFTTSTLNPDGLGHIFHGNIERYMRAVDGSGRETMVLNRLNPGTLAPAQAMCLWETRDGALWFCATDYGNPSRATNKNTYVYRSLDGGRTFQQVALMWDNNYRHAAPCKLNGKGVLSAAIKRNTMPSEIWARISPDGEDWTAAPVYVGDCAAPFKEPLACYQDHVGDLYVMTGNRKYRSTDGGASWGVMPT